MTEKKSDNRDLSSDANVDQDIHPPNTTSYTTSLGPKDQSYFEMRDQDGQKYLKYKSISGMDCMPRLREPTPPRHDFYEQRSESDDDEVDPDCKQCIKYKSKYTKLKERNLEMTKELERA